MRPPVTARAAGLGIFHYLNPVSVGVQHKSHVRGTGARAGGLTLPFCARLSGFFVNPIHIIDKHPQMGKTDRCYSLSLPFHLHQLDNRFSVTRGDKCT